MIARLQKSMKDKDQGFTLIELLVVIVIIGILAAIAIPLFLSQREKGVQTGIKSDLKAFATAQETHFVDNSAYTTAAANLKTAGWRATDGNVIKVGLAGAVTGYCVSGANPGTTTTYWYDSVTGAITTSKPATAGSACNATLDAAVLPLT